EGSVALRTAIRRLLEEGKKRILLNLAGVGYIDSSGIGELVSSYTAIGKEKGQLKLLNLTQKLQDLLTITKLLTVFDVYESEAEALNSFKKEIAMAELDLKERQAGDVTILDLSGEVRIGDSSVHLRESVRNLADQGKTKLLLNLAGVKYI